MRLVTLAALFALPLTAPAFAASETCTTQPATLRESAATAEPGKASRAMYLISVGEKLCAAGAPQEAASKFALAAKTLGAQQVALKTATAPAQ